MEKWGGEENRTKKGQVRGKRMERWRGEKRMGEVENREEKQNRDFDTKEKKRWGVEGKKQGTDEGERGEKKGKGKVRSRESEEVKRSREGERSKGGKTGENETGRWRGERRKMK